MIGLALLLAAETATAPAPGAALQAALKSVKQDGAVALSDAAQADVVALLPPARKGEECAEPANVASEAHALRDRGDGALLVVGVTTCKGGRVFALSTGQPPRVARLVDSQPDEVRGVKAVALGGGNRERDLALELQVSPTTSELRLLQHGSIGFAFSDAGTIKEFSAVRECAAPSQEGSGWSSWLRADQDRLAVLRTDGTCAGGVWQAVCALYRFDQGELARSGHCNLPPKLDAKALRASGWK